MNTIISFEILLVFSFFVFLFIKSWSRRWHNSVFPVNWPVIAMLPGLISNGHRTFDYVTELLLHSEGTFSWKGPWFTNMNMLLTCDPTNIHYILSKNFSNFSKGPDFKTIFDVLGDGIFNSDLKSWELQRKFAMLLLNHHRFQKFVQESSWKKVENGLMPVLESVSQKGTQVDLQQVFQRYTFDVTCTLVLGHDPATLSKDMPYISYESAFGDAEEAVLYRHVVPEFCWKLQRWLQIGKEKKLSEAATALDKFLVQCIALKRSELRKIGIVSDRDLEKHPDLLTYYLMQVEENNVKYDKGIKEEMLNLVFAGRDTVGAALTWFFWLIATNPFEENKIRKEITTILRAKGDEEKWRILSGEELKSLIYLHGALCEALRLFPPVSLQHKSPREDDVLPSGHHVVKDSRTVLSFYSMGRMESIWGKDCLEFKPERWITEQGGIKYEPSYKFTAFNAGPRSCLGKEMSFIQMKIVAANIIFHYKVDVVEGQVICPSDSVILHMKNGLKVRITKRCV